MEHAAAGRLHKARTDGAAGGRDRLDGAEGETRGAVCGETDRMLEKIMREQQQQQQQDYHHQHNRQQQQQQHQQQQGYGVQPPPSAPYQPYKQSDQVPAPPNNQPFLSGQRPDAPQLHMRQQHYHQSGAGAYRDAQEEPRHYEDPAPLLDGLGRPVYDYPRDPGGGGREAYQGAGWAEQSSAQYARENGGGGHGGAWRGQVCAHLHRKQF